MTDQSEPRNEEQYLAKSALREGEKREQEYLTVPEYFMEAFAPVVEQLSGT